MRQTITLLSLLISPAVFAQREVVRPSQLGQLAFQLDRLEQLMKDRSAGIRRDAFIISQVVAGIGNLDDFQRNAALQKARDRVDATKESRAQEEASSDAEHEHNAEGGGQGTENRVLHLADLFQILPRHPV